MSNGGSDDEHEFLVYELAEWTAEDRARLSLLLEAQEVPHQWEGDELLVPEAEEERVDALLDEVEFPDALEAVDDAGDDEERYEVVSDLFVVMDRVADANPVDVELAAEAIAAVEAVLALPRPFGIDEHDWENIRRRAAAVSQGLQTETDDEVIVADAAVLRDLLRRFV
jgi:hypothetical protein